MDDDYVPSVLCERCGFLQAPGSFTGGYESVLECGVCTDCRSSILGEEEEFDGEACIDN